VEIFTIICLELGSQNQNHTEYYQLRVLTVRCTRSIEAKILLVNMQKTKVIRCKVDSGQVEESVEYPLGIYRQGVGINIPLAYI